MAVKSKCGKVLGHTTKNFSAPSNKFLLLAFYNTSIPDWLKTDKR